MANVQNDQNPPEGHRPIDEVLGMSSNVNAILKRNGITHARHIGGEIFEISRFVLDFGWKIFRGNGALDVGTQACAWEQIN
jgi:hypothetical protein